MLARAVVRRRFGQLGLGHRTGRIGCGSGWMVLAALAVFLLAPLAASEVPGERRWALGLGMALLGLALVVLLRGAIALLRCKFNPRNLAPIDTAVAGVAALAMALSAVLMGAVLSPLLRFEEARLVERDQSLRIDPASRLTAMELRCVEEFRALAKE
jgi:hypothetical protein